MGCDLQLGQKPELRLRCPALGSGQRTRRLAHVPEKNSAVTLARQCFTVRTEFHRTCNWPYLRKVKGEGSRLPVLRSVFRLPVGIGWLAVLRQHRLGIERVHLRGAAVQEEEDHALGLWREVRRLGGERSRRAAVRAASGRRSRACRSPCPRCGDSRVWSYRRPQFTNPNSFELSSTCVYCGQASFESLQKLHAHLDLLRRRLAPQQQPVRLADARRVVRLRLAAARQAARLLRHQVAVHEEQALQRDVRRHALVAGAVRIGEIEKRQHAVQLAPADEAVDRAAMILRLVQLLRRAAHLQIQIARDVEQRVAQRFGIQPLPVGAPQQPIVRIGREIGRRIIRAQLVRRGEHDLAMHGLDRPLVLDEAARQIIEQLRMRGTLAQLAEIAGRAHDSLAEMMLPDAIHHDARGQRIARIGDRLGQVQPAAAVRETAAARRRERIDTKMRRHHLALVGAIAAEVDMLRLRSWPRRAARAGTDTSPAAPSSAPPVPRAASSDARAIRPAR